MKKVLFALIPVIALISNAMAGCADGLTEKEWDKTASGYCKIFFPNCSTDDLGTRVKYSREIENGELLCVGQGGAYQDFYRVSISDANAVLDTEFTKMGVNYGSDLSKWLFDNCQNLCTETVVDAE